MTLVKHKFKHLLVKSSVCLMVFGRVFRAAGGSVISRNFRKMELCALKMDGYSKVALK